MTTGLRAAQGCRQLHPDILSCMHKVGTPFPALSQASRSVLVDLLVHGPAAHTIVSLATPNDLIVMTSHGRSGFRRWLLGSVADMLVRDAPCPVMLVRLEVEPEYTPVSVRVKLDDNRR